MKKKTVKPTTTKKQKDKQVRVLDDKDLARAAGGGDDDGWAQTGH